jgi:hypothetical protein
MRTLTFLPKGHKFRLSRRAAQLSFMFLLAPALLLNGCSSSNSEAPADTGVHPSAWFGAHSPAALASPDHSACLACHGPDLRGSGNVPSCFSCHSFNTVPPFTIHPQDFVRHAPVALTSPDHNACLPCHGLDLRGSADVTSCFSCHSFNTTPPFTIHPQSWQDPYTSHRAFATLNGTVSCASCHGQDLRGQQATPSCFSSSFNGRACHAAGPGQVPHPLDGSYLSGANHGPEAKADLIACQLCHGQPGGSGSNPRFNIGISSAGGNGCESCHGVNYAHPQNWGGPALPVHFEAGNIQNACSFCHGVNLDGVGGVGISCLACHTVSPGVNPTGCVSCHSVPPNGGGPAGNVSPNLSGQHQRAGHTVLISLIPSETCSRCHSGAGTGTVAHFDQTRPADVNLPLDPLNTITAVSDADNTTCTGNCHLVGDFGEFTFLHPVATWY